MEQIQSRMVWPTRGPKLTPASLIGFGIAGALALLSAISLIAYRSIDAFEASARLVAHTYSVIAQVGELQSAHGRMRFGWRGYVMGGGADALEDYRLGQQALRDQGGQIEALTRDNPAQHARVRALRDVIERDIEAANASIAQKRAGALDGSVAILETLGTLRENSERIAELANAVEQEERTLLATHEQQTFAQGSAAKTWIAAGSVGSLAALAFAFWLLRREMARTFRAQRNAERYAREVEDLYNRAPCGYHSVDARGVFTRINDTELAMLGYTREEVIGRMRHPDVMTPESADAFKRHFATFMRTGMLQGAEFTYRRKDGSTFNALADATAVRDAEGTIVESRTAVVDITDRKAAEMEARRLAAQLTEYSARLEDTNKELESFSYSVSHDLRAPLRAINGFALMLDEDYRDRLDEEGRRLLGVVRANAESMARLIDDLLAFSRLSKTSLVSGSVDMNVLVREVLTELGATSAEIRTQPLPLACGDRSLLKQVWANLIGNAVKYSGNVAAPVIVISGREEPDGCCEYSVEDNGAGFDMRYYDKLFGVFQRLHSSNEFPGTGVGLAIVQRIVTRHGGRVWAEGRSGSGATFHFRLRSGGASA